MRILPTDEHQLRKEKILQAVIHIFIKTGTPVGSTTLLENFNLSLSPATVRNVLAELEVEGFLTHPHTSAGRVPTDSGYRNYVDSIVKIQKLAEEEEQRIRHEYKRRIREVEDLMQSTTRILSSLSHCTGFAMRPVLDHEQIRRVELVPVSNTQVLGVLVSESGMVRNKMIAMPQSPQEASLRRASRFLSEKLKGLSFDQAENKILAELEKFHSQYEGEKDLMETISRDLFHSEPKMDLYVEGTSNMLNFPEFRDLDHIRSFAFLVDGKEALAKILGKELNKRGLEVQIGIKSPPELKEFSLVSTCYRVKGRPLGVLGILGPKRMEYERMMSIVNTVAELVNRFFDQDNQEKLLEE